MPAELAQRPRRSLSRKLLVLTILFVMLAEVLIFVPSVANMRLRWLHDQVNRAAGTSVIIDGLKNVELPDALQRQALMATGTKAIALKMGDATRLIASVDDMPSAIAQTTDLADIGPLTAIGQAFDTLILGGHRPVRVYGPVAHGKMVVDMVLDDTALRNDMLVYVRNVLLLSLLISLITAGLVFFSINRMMIRPIQDLIDNMRSFSEAPEDPERIIAPGSGDDEIGLARRHLAALEEEIRHMLKQQANLASLGLAVSKINHDMRNILSSAQLMSDRLSTVDDPVVKRLAPKLLRTIDRAVGYSRAVMAYGQAREAAPTRRRLALAALVEDVRDLLDVDGDLDIAFVIDVPDDLMVDADSEQLFRIVHNLARNACEAMQDDDRSDAALVRRIKVAACREADVVHIRVEDTGPGLPATTRENLFAPFRGSSRSGGTGLGLAIVRELVTAHGGTIALEEPATPGTRFHIALPDRRQEAAAQARAV
nr:HAMP domain-containing sensor histidine kinase [Pararhizobium mangrovi]